MRILLRSLSAVLLLAALTSACTSGDSDEGAVPVESSPTPPPMTTMVPPAITPECAPMTAANVSRLAQSGSAETAMGSRLKWSPDSETLWAIARSEVRAFDAASLQQLHTYPSPTDILDFSPATGLAALGSNQQGNIQLRELTTGVATATITPAGPYGSVAFSADGRSLAVSLLSQLAVEIWDPDTGRLVQTVTGFETAAPVYSASFSTDGASLIWLSRAKVQLTDLASGQLGLAFEHEDFVFSVAAASGKMATASGTGIRLWDASSGAVLADLPLGSVALTTQLSEDTALIFGGTDVAVSVFDGSTHALLAQVEAPGSEMALSADDCKLAVASGSGELMLLTVRP